MKHMPGESYTLNQSAALFAYQRAYDLQPSDAKYAEAAGKKSEPPGSKNNE
jgi:hypothetical protein